MKKFFLTILILPAFVACGVLEFGPCLLHYLEPCTNNTIQFYLFTSSRPRDAPILLDIDRPIVPDYINLAHEMKLVVHGYAGNLDFNATRSIRNAYLWQRDVNLLIVDWGHLAKYPCYPSAAFNTRQAGACIADFLIELEERYPEFVPFKIHAIGFSLGAHVVGFTSNVLENKTHIPFARITGLDPALPFFATTNHEWKLDSSDADFVDVIHTNAGLFGKIEQCGDVDFYVNGGRSQPQCRKSKNKPLCSHMFATEYFAESIWTNVGFYGSSCNDYIDFVFGWCEDDGRKDGDDDDGAEMGENCQKGTKGVYYVETNRKSPYAKGSQWRSSHTPYSIHEHTLPAVFTSDYETPDEYITFVENYH